LFCDTYVTGGGTLIAQDNFRDVLTGCPVARNNTPRLL
jgi:hypothetical protein